MNASLLLVEEDPHQRHLLTQLLLSSGYDVTGTASPQCAADASMKEPPDVVLLDLDVARGSAMSALEQVRASACGAPVIAFGGPGSIETVIGALRGQAFDYLTKPLRPDELLRTVERGLETSRARRHIAYLGREASRSSLCHLVGNSPPMLEMFARIRRVAPLNVTVLVTGETGTGKELVARAIHELSDRSRKPFVPVQCSSLAKSLLESELFGHVKGSFTGAIANRRGCFEDSHGGTLFLDEIGTMTLDTQVKLLRVLQDRSIQRVGASESIPIDFRLIGASNVALKEEVAAGRFREDLYFRLNVFPIRIPPLRERRSDIPLLVATFLTRFSHEHRVPMPELDPRTMSQLMEYDWPGNVRELENYVERALILHDWHEPAFESPRQIEQTEQHVLTRARQETWTLEQLNKEYTLSVLEQTRGRQSEAAALLGISRRTLYRKLREYGQHVASPPLASA